MASSLSRRGLHGQIVDVLGERILKGELQPGEIIDPEVLNVELGVSRTVLREAIKVLGAKGLIDARPRLGTYVTERSNWQLLDSDVMAWRTKDTPDSLLVRELGEVRRIIEPAAARMAASRSVPKNAKAITDALDRMAAARDNGPAMVQADMAFHRAVLVAAGNELLERFEVILEPALNARHTLAFSNEYTLDFLKMHERVHDAIRDGDEYGAFMAMDQLIKDATADDVVFLGQKADS